MFTLSEISYCATFAQELRYAHEEMLKQKTGFQSRLQDREAEIERLRGQVRPAFRAAYRIARLRSSDSVAR